jgi:hypothetical protein
MDKEEIQKEWNAAALHNFIRRMLLYHDPWELTIMMAPDDEYDSYIGKVYHFLEESLDEKFLEKSLYDLFKNDSDNEHAKRELNRKAKRMAEDLIYLLKSE